MVERGVGSNMKWNWHKGRQELVRSGTARLNNLEGQSSRYLHRYVGIQEVPSWQGLHVGTHLGSPQVHYMRDFYPLVKQSDVEGRTRAGSFLTSTRGVE